MITTLRGVLQHVSADSVVLEVGGVGLQVHVPTSVVQGGPALGEVLFLHTYLVVREDELSLYGFRDTEERSLFELLNSVSGIGPRLAMATLSHLSPEMIRSAVGNDQPELLTRVPGIGKKSAQRVIFQLKDKLAAPPAVDRTAPALDTEVIGVLTALGYNLVEAQTAVQSLPEDAPEDVEERVRLALRYFARF